MCNYRIHFKLVILYLTLVATLVSAHDSNIQVVTSFSILQDLVKELGGEYVSIVNLVGRNSDAHRYEPKPSDVVAIANADLVIFNGLGFEGWMARLLENSSYKNKQLIASDGVDIVMNGDEIDPHAWQSFKNIRSYINNITQMLIALRPQHRKEFIEYQQQYLNHLTILEKKLLKQLENIPINQRIVVTSHDAFGYLGRELNIAFLAPLGFSTETEASAKDVAAVINQIRKQGVKALFFENINNQRLLQRIAAETGVTIGGRLYSDALSKVDEPAGTYLNMMHHNIKSLIVAFHSP